MPYCPEPPIYPVARMYSSRTVLILIFASAQDNVHYNKMKGFHFYRDHMGAELRLPVSHWSSDGIHCNGTSMPMYISRLRRALLLQVPNMN